MVTHNPESTGSLATAVITWRNSLVFHDHDKMVSLFIHMYPPLVLTVLRHFYPNAGARWPALEVLPTLHPVSALCWSALFCKRVIYFSPRYTRAEEENRIRSALAGPLLALVAGPPKGED